MDKKYRLDEIEKITSNLENKIADHEIYWINETKPLPVFKIPLSLLLFNPYNGRIASNIKTIEKHWEQDIDITNQEHQSIIKNFIWESKIDSNKKTLANLKERGQMLPATITRDGVLIDGNRRAMLLNKMQETYIKTIVLPVTLEEDPIAIQELEYEYQIAVDEKVDYNPIEKYIKANDLYNRYKSIGVNENKILNDLSKLNGFGKKNHSKVKELLETYDLMIAYLKSIDAAGYLVLLDKKEDLFLSLRNWLTTFLHEDGSNKESKKGFAGYDEIAVADLQDLSFDFIRAEIEGKSFRKIAQGNSGSHIFSIKPLWNDFRREHQNIIKGGGFEFDLQLNSENYIEELKSMNKKFKSIFQTKFSKNLEDYDFKVTQKKYDEEPTHKLDEVNEILDNNNIKRKIHSDPEEAMSQLKEVAKKSISLMNRKPLLQLESILELLMDVDVDFLSDGSETNEFEKVLTDINKLSYQLKKKL